MVIKELVLENFMRVKNAKLVFDTGVNILRGKNRSGKSTVFEAIGLALLGRKRGDTFVELIRRGANSFYVRLSLDNNGKPLTIELKATKGVSTLEKTIHFDQGVYLNSDATAFLDKEFGIDVLESTVFSFQKGPSIAEMRPAERKELLNEVFKLDFLKSGVDNLIEDMNDVEKEVNALTSTVGVLSLIKFEQNPIMPLPFDETIFKIKEQELADKTTLSVNLGNQVKELEQVQRERESHNRVCNDKKNTLVRKTKELADLENSIAYIQTDLQKDTSTLEEYKASLVHKIEELNKVKENPLLALNEADRKLTQDKINSSEFETRRLKHLIGVHEKGECPECGQSINPKHSNEVRKALELVMRDTESLNKAINQFYSKDIVQASIRDIENTIKGLESSIKLYEQKILSHNDKYSGVVSTVPLLKDSMLLLQKEVQDIEEKLLVDSGPFIRQLQGVNQELRLLSEEIKSYSQTIFVNEERRKANVVLAEKEIQHARELKELQVRVNTKSVELEYLHKTKKVMEKELPQFSLLAVCKEVEKLMNDFISTVEETNRVKLFPSKTGIEVAYINETVLQDIEEAQQLQESDSIDNYLSIKMSSGFERELITLAFKIAVAKFYKMRILVLDEIDSASSDENSFETFRALAQLDMEQVFIISHKVPTVDRLMNEYPVRVYNVESGNFTLA